MQKLGDEVWAFITKAGVWLCSIGIGLIAKISQDLMMKKKRPLLQWVGVIGISIFWGYLTSVYCVSHDMESQGKFLVPMSTLFGEKILLYITANWEKFLDFFSGTLKTKK